MDAVPVINFSFIQQICIENHYVQDTRPDALGNNSYFQKI